jgi:UDP-3-O-[3-hydroxymyristoyl] glucosamine N-acyltransferase
MESDPNQLPTSHNLPYLPYCGPTLAELKRDYQLISHKNYDITLESLGPLSHLSDYPNGGLLTYLNSPHFAAELQGEKGHAVITTAELIDKVPHGNIPLVTKEDPQECFYGILYDLFDNRGYQKLLGHRSETSFVANTAFVDSNVYIDDGAWIGPGVALFQNTYIGKGVIVQANSVIGSDGFEPKRVRGRRIIVPHTGGVWLSEGVLVGANTAIDRSLFGRFTHIGQDTKIDNQIHVAHNVTIGQDCSLVAGAEVSGSVTLGDGTWLGPCVAINQ